MREIEPVPFRRCPSSPPSIATVLLLPTLHRAHARIEGKQAVLPDLPVPSLVAYFVGAFVPVLRRRRCSSPASFRPRLVAQPCPGRRPCLVDPLGAKVEVQGAINRRRSRTDCRRPPCWRHRDAARVRLTLVKLAVGLLPACLLSWPRPPPVSGMCRFSFGEKHFTTVPGFLQVCHCEF